MARRVANQTAVATILQEKRREKNGLVRIFVARHVQFTLHREIGEGRYGLPLVASAFRLRLYWNVPSPRAERLEAAEALLLLSTDEDVGSASDVSPVA